MSEHDERERAERKAPLPDEFKIRKTRRNVNFEARAEARAEWNRRHAGIWLKIEAREAERKKLHKVKCVCGHRGDKHRDGRDGTMLCFACGWREKDRCRNLRPE